MMKRPSSASHYRKKILNESKQKYFNKKSFINHNNYNLINDDILDELSEEINILQNYWDDFGITPEYRSLFLNILKNVNDAEKNDLLSQERASLKKFGDALLNIKKEINNRENNIIILKKLNMTIENFINTEGSNLIENILQDVISIIKALRINAKSGWLLRSAILRIQMSSPIISDTFLSPLISHLTSLFRYSDSKLCDSSKE